MMNKTINETVKSVMIGHAVGDALGVPVEFCSREELLEKPVTDMVGYGVYDVPAGAWSDDTSMSLCALDALRREDWRWEHIMANFIAWLEKGEYSPIGECFDVGRGCLDAILSYCRGGGNALSCGGVGEYSNGNGSLMRIHPFVLYAYANRLPLDEQLALVDDGSKMTHAHERSRLACLIYTFVLDSLLRDPSKDAVRQGLKAAVEHLGEWGEMTHYKRLFEGDIASLQSRDIKSSGYVVDTLEAALWCLLTTESYKECVNRAVNLGGDSDTTAAVAGGLAGALYGYGSIPEEWKGKLMKRDYIEELCDRAVKAWGNA